MGSIHTRISRSVEGSRNTSSVRCQPSWGTWLSPWRRRLRLSTSATSRTPPRTSQTIIAPPPPPPPPPRSLPPGSLPRGYDHRRAVGDDLGEALADLRGVEPHPHDRVRSQQARVLDHAVHCMAAAVLEQFRVLADLAALERLPGGAEPLREAHRPDDETEAGAQRALHLPSGEVERGRHGHRGGLGLRGGRGLWKRWLLHPSSFPGLGP